MCVFEADCFFGGVVSRFVVAVLVDEPPQQSIRERAFHLVLAGCIVFVFLFKNGFGALSPVLGYFVSSSAN